MASDESTLEAMTDVVVVSGEGRYADPWHDFVGTSARVAELLGELGLTTQVRGTDSPPVPAARLLVVNTGGGGNPPTTERAAAADAWREAVLDHAAGGRPVLALHTACNTFTESPAWAQITGGRWVVGTSMHPPYGPARVQVTGGDHPITRDLGTGLDIVDERYLQLEIQGDIVPLVQTEHEGRNHPLVWAHRHGEARIVVDTLGHDVAAYDGADRRALLRREVDWLLGGGREAAH